MKRTLLCLNLLIGAAVSTGGCMPVLQAPIGLPTDPTASMQIDYGYSILENLLEDESSVGEILQIKSTSQKTSSLLKTISAAAKEAKANLAPLLAKEPVVSVGETGLPIVEESTRNRITNIQTARLLLAGSSFEVKVLLTQANAMGYGRSLAASLAEADPSPDRSKFLGQLENTLADLESQVIVRLLTLSGS